MAAIFVVDASVVVEFLAPGSLGDEADRFMGGLTWREPIALVAPDLLFLEVASALDRLARRGDLSAEAAGRAVARLPSLPIGAVPSPGLLEGAWPLRGNATIYDAAYLALARALEVPLVTADGRLVRAGRTLGMRTLSVDGDELETLLATIGSER